jgi:hypothetical protein
VEHRDDNREETNAKGEEMNAAIVLAFAGVMLLLSALANAICKLYKHLHNIEADMKASVDAAKKQAIQDIKEAREKVICELWNERAHVRECYRDLPDTSASFIDAVVAAINRKQLK